WCSASSRRLRPARSRNSCCATRCSRRRRFRHRASFGPAGPRWRKVSGGFPKRSCSIEEPKAYIPHSCGALLARHDRVAGLFSWTVDGGWYFEQLKYLRLHRGWGISKLFDQAIAVVKRVFALILKEAQNLFNGWCLGCSAFRQRAE